MSVGPYLVNLPDAAERLRQNHAIEWAYRWQYAVTFRILRGIDPAAVDRKPPAILREPPPGDGWEINTDFATVEYEAVHASKGYEVVVPAWCTDGTAAVQRLHWRRPAPDMKRGDINQKLSILRGDQ